jgi:hypothetical protein
VHFSESDIAGFGLKFEKKNKKQMEVLKSLSLSFSVHPLPIAAVQKGGSNQFMHMIASSLQFV